MTGKRRYASGKKAEPGKRRVTGKSRSGVNQSGKKKNSRRKKTGFRHKLGTTLYWSAVIVVFVLVFLTGTVLYYALDLPDTESIWSVDTKASVTFIGHDGAVLMRRGGRWAEAVHLEELPPYLPQAVIAIEDRRFYRHIGLDMRGLARAFWENLKAFAWVQGGSTLSQQLAKNVFLGPERTLKRKVQELLLAFWLESQFTKDQLLTLYLNRVYLGAGVYGVEAASRRYFDQSARDITLAQAAMLAGLLKAPSRYSPVRNLKRAQERAAIVLAAMAREGFISPGKTQNALDHPAVLQGYTGGSSVHYAADWMMNDLPAYAGQSHTSLRVQTTLDPELQRVAEEVVKRALERSGKTLDASQAALVAMTPDGAVRAMIGGASYKKSQFNRAVQARRQPGSAFKPVVYLTALEQGLTPDTLRLDAPVSIGDWQPSNHSGRYQGLISLQEAFAQSVNMVAVRLSEEVGRENVIRMARKLGIVSPLRPHPSLALGAFEVSLLELTTAYAGFANHGRGVIPHAIERIETRSGTLLYERFGEGPGALMSSRSLGAMNHMLAQVIETGTGRRARLPDRPAAGKTGTSQGFRDAWFVGFTSGLVVGVWVGNDDARPMKGVSGSGLPAEIWRDFVIRSQKNTRPAKLPGYYVSSESGVDKSAVKKKSGESGQAGFFERLFGFGRSGQKNTVPGGNKKNAQPSLLPHGDRYKGR